MAGIRRNETPIAHAFWAYYPLVLHAIMSSIIAAFMIHVIDGIVVNYNGQKFALRWQALRVDDITTIISVLLLVLRSSTTAWIARSAWGWAFILLETDGATLIQFNRIVSWPIFWVGWSRTAFIASVSLLLLVPANTLAPVLTGAVSWRSISVPANNTTFTQVLDGQGSAKWYWYLQGYGGYEADAVILKAGSYADIGWSPRDPPGGGCRMVVGFDQTMPINSTVNSIILPCLKIDKISWGTEKNLHSNVTNGFSGALQSNLTVTGRAPFAHMHSGNAILFDDAPLDKPYRGAVHHSDPWAPLPRATTYSGTRKFALRLNFQRKGTGCASVGPSIFGDTEMMAKIKGAIVTENGASESCFLTGLVTFTAGITRSPEAKYIAERVIESEPEGPLLHDPWVDEALRLLPDVMPRVSQTNASGLATWGDIEGYLERLIRISYMAAWDALAVMMNTEPLNLTAHEHASRLKGVVSRRRVYAWYAAQMLVLISGAMFGSLQMVRNRPAIIDGGAAALMVDSTQVLDEHELDDLTRLSYATHEDCHRRKFWLVPDSREDDANPLMRDSESAEMLAPSGNREVDPPSQRLKLALSREPGSPLDMMTPSCADGFKQNISMLRLQTKDDMISLLQQ